MGKRTAHKRPIITGLSRFVAATQPKTAETFEPPVKRRKFAESVPEANSPLGKATRATNSAWIPNYDASGSVPHYSNEEDVPEHLLKYYAQRTRFLSLYSQPPGCLLDEEGWYSITPEKIATRIAERCRCDTILDPFCGVGGNAIAFAKTCQRVIALDTSATRLSLARHNAQIYGVADRIEFILADYLQFADAYLSRLDDARRPSLETRKIDVVFLSPPWGGPSYISAATSRPPSPTKESSEAQDHPSYSLSSIQPIHGARLFALSRKITKNVAFYLPRNVDVDEVGSLLTEAAENEKIEVEEEWMRHKLKAVTCYFGGLVDGQEDLY